MANVNIGGKYQAGIGLSEPIPNAGAPVNGVVGTGTYAGIAPKGALLNDVTNAILYQNTGTIASPVWTKVGTET
jgi:hypothetical protein